MDRVSSGDAERDEKTQARLASLKDVDLYRWGILRGQRVPRRSGAPFGGACDDRLIDETPQSKLDSLDPRCGRLWRP